MSNINTILELAQSQLGNDGEKYWNWYTDTIRPEQGYYINGDATPYCAEYMSWLLAQTGTYCYHFPDPCAFDYRDVPENLRINKYDVRIGDIVSYDWDEDVKGDHVGLVIETHSWGIIANEGNTNGGIVANRERYWSNILFGIRPQYFDGPFILDVDGYIGPKSVIRMQQLMDTVQDGVISGQAKVDDVYRPNVVAVDYCGQGSDMVRALQSWLGIDCDGYWGYHTSYALQWLIGADMDGYFGPESAKQLQRYLNQLEV